MIAPTGPGHPADRLDELAFDGRPFDALAAIVAATPQPVAVPPAPAQPIAAQPVTAQPTTARPVAARSTTAQPAPPHPVTAQPEAAVVPTAAEPGSPAAVAARLVAQVRDEIVAAHLAAMDVQTRWQEQTLAALGDGPGPAPTTRLVRSPTPTRGVPAPGGRLVLAWTGVAGEEPVVVDSSVVGPAPDLALAPGGYRPEGALEPLATTSVSRLGPAELAHLASGRAGDVLGPRYAPAPALPAGPLTAVTELRTGGPVTVGVLRATTPAPRGATDVIAAGWHAASVLATWLGLHLVLSDATPVPGSSTTVDLVDLVEAGGEAELAAEVVAADLLPRPWLTIDAELRVAGRVVARLSGLTLALDGTPAATRRGGHPPAAPVRRGVTGALAAVDELALATASLGDLTPALGPEFARYADRRATRPPAGGLRLVGRVMQVHGTRGELSGGAVGVTEYDSAADAWYYGAAPSPTVPNVVLMETSLQSALLLGYHLGATLVDPGSDYCLRNLDGSATLHRDVDLRGRTVHQRSTLLSTTVLTGAVLQGFTYELWLDGENPGTDAPFYSGQSLFGFFTATALANQTGLDNGASAPNWLEEHPDRPVRTIDAAVGATGPLALLSQVEVVDGGGRHGAGYLRAVRPVDPTDWFFARHFHLDPVMPGSLGIEAVIQALQAWLVDSGAARDLTEPEFVVPAGVALTWRYRGQILAGDGQMTLEVHVREVQRRDGRVRVIADAGLWKPGLRIYELHGIAAELREKGAPQW